MTQIKMCLDNLSESFNHFDEAVDYDKGGRKSGIKFHIIEIREYERTVGDNPSCSSGPPIS